MDTDALRGFSAQRLAELTHTHISTARRWLRRRSAPPAVLMALTFLRFGDLGAISEKWTGWGLRADQLWSPENVAFTPGMVRAGPLFEQCVRNYRAADAAQPPIIDTEAERRRVRTLAALENAFNAAQRALEELRADLTELERRKVHEQLDTTRERRAQFERRERQLSEYAAEARKRLAASAS